MRRTAVRVVLAVFVAGSAAIGFSPVASASTDSTLVPSVEAWYQPNPSCLTPAGCVTTGSLPVVPPVPVPDVPAASPYPAGTLHVGVAAGQEVARTYLGFPFASLVGQTVSAATLMLPLDVSAADGSTTPETSKVLVCLTTSSKLTATEGTLNAPPTVECGAAVAAKYVATPQPHLQADLGSLAADLAGATGLALLPDAGKTTQTDAWRVVFSAHTRTDAAKTAPPTLTVTVADQLVAGPPVTDPVPSLPGPVAAPPAAGTGFVPAPPVQAPVAGVVPPAVSNPAPQVPAVTAPRLVTVGYAYPVVWLLPLAFLVLVPATARALTKDLSAA